MSAQATTYRLNDSSACSGCIRIHPVATLQGPDTGDYIGLLSQVAQSADGRFAVVGNSRQRVLLYDRNGRLTRQFGRNGRGPGEMQQITRVAFSADSLFVFEAGRYQVFSPALTLVRSEAWPPTVQGAVIRSNGQLVANLRRVADQSEYALQLLQPSGVVVRTFAESRVPAGPTCIACFPTISPALASDEVLLVPYNRYGWETWGDDGHVHSQVEITSSWFKPWHESANWVTTGALRPPTLLDVSIDDLGLYWLRSTVGSPTRRTRAADDSGPGRLRAVDGGVIGNRGAVEAMLERIEDRIDTRVEVASLSEGRVKATLRIPGGLVFLRFPYAARKVRKDDGSYSIDVVRLQFTSP